LDNFISILNQQDLPLHRLEKVATIKGVDFYNDSKSTISASTLAAVTKIQHAHRPIILFLGGLSKGVDRSELVRNLAGKVNFIYCFGTEAAQLKGFCEMYNIPASAWEKLDDAFEALTLQMKPHDQVLFSPAGTSFDLFANYQERGDYFKKLVTHYHQSMG
jgi:UDP-N-acetylmuramoylalanine--D-glutamate ligase